MTGAGLAGNDGDRHGAGLAGFNVAEAPKSPAVPWERDFWQGAAASVLALVLFHYSWGFVKAGGVLEPLKTCGMGGPGSFSAFHLLRLKQTNISLKQKISNEVA